MGKQKKKRNKAYTGTDAAVTKPVITRITATNRSKIGQWWFEHKTVYTPILKVAGIIFVVIIIFIEIIRVITGGSI